MATTPGFTLSNRAESVVVLPFKLIGWVEGMATGCEIAGNVATEGEGVAIKKLPVQATVTIPSVTIRKMLLFILASLQNLRKIGTI
jgi:hypothetical protein